MKVKIENTKGERDAAQRGLTKMFKTPEKITYYQVSLYLDLTEEERAILTEYDLWDAPIYNGTFEVASDEMKANPELSSIEGNTLRYCIRDLADDNGFHQTFSTPLPATNLVRELKETVLPRIKLYIANTRQYGPGASLRFEL